MSENNYDIAVVGAGIMGLSSAYYLKKQFPGRSLIVLEKEPSYSQGNSGRSVAGYRDFFSTDVNRKLAGSSIKFYRHIQEDLSYNLGMLDVGYLFLMSKRKYELNRETIASLKNTTELQILNRSDLSAIDPIILEPERKESEILNLEPIEVGVLGKNCGVLDIDKLSSYYFNECREIGVDFSFNTEVESLGVRAEKPTGYPGEPFLWQNKTISEISTSAGEYHANNYVFATGAWTGMLLDRIGVDSHIRAKKRFVYQVSGECIKKMVDSSYGLNDEGVFPFTILPSHGVYLRPYQANGSFWVSTSGTTSDGEVGPRFSYDSPQEIKYVQPDEEYFTTNILPVLVAYVRDLDSLKITGSWTGYYSLNTQDKTPYIFPFLNAVVATGGSGAGLMKSDSIGRIVAGIVSKNEYTDLFDGSRIANNSLGVAGRNVGIESLKF